METDIASRSGRRCVAVTAAITAVAMLGLPAGSAQAVPCTTGTDVTLISTGAEQCYTVPAGGTLLHVVAVGAPGGSGGFGATVTGNIPVTPNQTFFVEVGGPGQGASGGFNGGGDGQLAFGGGGASDVRTTLAGDRRLLVAGGGGGAGAAFTSAGGAGGSAGATAAAGTDGSNVDANAQGGRGGGGATPSAGGAAGAGGFGTAPAGNPGSPGQAGLGGAGGFSGGGGGGGGGGYYGGGGGGEGGRNSSAFRAGGGGGGAGSSLAPSGGSIVTDGTGIPSVTIKVITPTASASPSSLNFGQRGVGTLSPPQRVTVSNGVNGAALMTSGFSLEGPGADDYLLGSFNGCSTPVTADSPCELQVSFVPHAAGPSNAVLRITSNAANSPTLVALSGVGVSPRPAVTHLTESATKWRAGNELAQLTKKRKPPIGTTFRFSLNEPAAMRFDFTQRAAGRKVARKCVPQSKHNRHKPKCRSTVTVGTLSFNAHAGANKVRFQGRLSRTRKLRPSRYTLTVTATTGSSRSQPRSISFTIVKR